MLEKKETCSIQTKHHTALWSCTNNSEGRSEPGTHFAMLRSCRVLVSLDDAKWMIRLRTKIGYFEKNCFLTSTNPGTSFPLVITHVAHIAARDARVHVSFSCKNIGATIQGYSVMFCVGCLLRNKVFFL